MGPKISVAIPYRQRIDNLRLCLQALSEQTVRGADLEVIVGAMDYDPELGELVRSFLDRLNIIMAVSPHKFEISAARNLAMRNATGTLCIQIDADTFLAPDALAALWTASERHGHISCLVGRIVGYGNNNDGDVEHVDVQPKEALIHRLEDLKAYPAADTDPRFAQPINIPWAFVWTGLVGLPTAAVRAHDLYFDESFTGWGVDDLEWGYRIHRAGLPIVLEGNACGLHLPHQRSMAANKAFEQLNFRRLLRKWPSSDVELVSAFNDMEANVLYPAYKGELERLSSLAGYEMSVLLCKGPNKMHLVIGVRSDDRQTWRSAMAGESDIQSIESINLLGLALPFEDNSFDSCLLAPTIGELPPIYHNRIRQEAQRVSVTTPVTLSIKGVI